jgi:hypothetical protein
MRRRIARTLDRLIAGLIEGPMIDQGALDALINAAADLDEKSDASDRTTNAIAESPPVTK